MTIEELRVELESLVSNLGSADLKSVEPGIMDKLGKLGAAAGDLGMKEGKHLIENLAASLKAIGEGKSQAESGAVRITALDFYVKKLSGGGNIEEL